MRYGEDRVPVGHLRRIRDHEARAEFVERAALAGRYAAGTRHEAADAAVVQRVDFVGAFGGLVGFVGNGVVVRRQAGFVRIVVHHRYRERLGSGEDPLRSSAAGRFGAWYKKAAFDEAAHAQAVVQPESGAGDGNRTHVISLGS